MAKSTSQNMKSQQTSEKQCGCQKSAISRDKTVGYSIAMGTALGAGVGAAMQNVAVGIAIGVALGTAIGAALARKKGKD